MNVDVRDLNMMRLAADLLEMAAEEFGDNTCTDYTLSDTPENRELVIEVDGEDFLHVEDGEIFTDDFSLMYFCADRLREFVKVEELLNRVERRKKVKKEVLENEKVNKVKS